jgi:hypothetical protein
MASSTKINQSSAFAPAVCFHNKLFHMAFVANNASHDLLHATSQDGIHWTRKNNIGQSTKAAPAIASLGQLRVVFVANNDTNTLLTCFYDEAHDSWSQNNPIVGQSSKTTPALALPQPANRLMMYFVANNDSNDLLVLDISE